MRPCNDITIGHPHSGVPLQEWCLQEVVGWSWLTRGCAESCHVFGYSTCVRMCIWVCSHTDTNSLWVALGMGSCRYQQFCPACTPPLSLPVVFPLLAPCIHLGRPRLFSAQLWPPAQLRLCPHSTHPMHDPSLLQAPQHHGVLNQAGQCPL